MVYIFFIFISYVIGSIPSGYLVGKYCKKVDIREFGSGNIGATNSFRVLGAKYAFIVLVGDCLKGFLAIVLTRWMVTEKIEFCLLMGLFAIIGHNWSVFLRFKGGKGIATTYGVILAFYPYIAIIAAIVWGIIVLKTKFASLGSIISVFSMFLLSFVFKTPLEFKIFTLFIILFALTRHRSNIHRLLHRKENKIINKSDKK